MRCPGCDKIVPDETVVCPECGVYVLIAQKNQKNCPYCSEKIEVDAYVCKHCKRDLTKDSREWFQKKRNILALFILEMLIVGIVVMSLKDFGNIVKEFKYKNNRLEIVSTIAQSLDDFSQTDSLQKFEYKSDKNLEIEFLIFTYNKRSLQRAIYNILENIAPLLKKEYVRFDSVKITANTPIDGKLTSTNSLLDIIKIENGRWEFADWLLNTEFKEKDLF